MPRVPPEKSRFKKGQSGNPNGARAHSPILREVRKLSREELAKVFMATIHARKQELTEIIANPDSPMILVNLATALIKDTAKGQTFTLQMMFDRLFGRPKTSVELCAIPPDPNRPDAIAVESVQIVLTLPDNGRSVDSTRKDELNGKT